VEEASKRLAEARRLAELIRREATGDRIMERHDLKALYADPGAR
jgi:hypothetical protein